MVKNANPTRANRLRRTYKFEAKAKPTAQWESQLWFQLLEDLLGAGQQVADLIGVSRQTYYRWRAGEAPNEWWRRHLYMSIYNEVRASVYQKDRHTGIIPIQRYKDLAARIKKSDMEVLSSLMPSSLYAKLEIGQEPMSSRLKCIIWLYNRMEQGVEYVARELREEAEELSFRGETLQKATAYLKIEKQRHRQVKEDGTVRVWSTWVRDGSVDIDHLVQEEDEED